MNSCLPNFSGCMQITMQGLQGPLNWKTLHPEVPLKQTRISEWKCRLLIWGWLQNFPYIPLWHPIQKWYTPSHQAVWYQADRLSSQTVSHWHKLHWCLSASTRLWKCRLDKSHKNNEIIKYLIFLYFHITISLILDFTSWTINTVHFINYIKIYGIIWLSP